jgi:hypothetical protein
MFSVITVTSGMTPMTMCRVVIDSAKILQQDDITGANRLRELEGMTLEGVCADEGHMAQQHQATRVESLAGIQ